MGDLIKYSLLGGEISFNKEVLEYGKLKKEFDAYGVELSEVIGEFYEKNKDHVVDMYEGENQYYDYMYRQLVTLINHIDEHMKKYIKVLVEHGLYDRSEDYYTKNNSALMMLFEMTDLKYQIKSLLWEQMNCMISDQIDDAHFNAYSQVHGNQYGLITNSVASSILYGIENEYKIKKSTEKAERQYASALDRIGLNNQKWFENKWIGQLTRIFGKCFFYTSIYC